MRYDRRRKYCNPNFFDTPNIINSYWAGYLAGDGSILKNGIIELACASRDEEILQAFKLATKAENNILKRTFDTRGTICHRSRLVFTGRYDWQENLLKYWNVGQRKSFTLCPPNITDQQQIAAYIIGLTDADGSVCFCTQRQGGRTKYLFTMAWIGTENIVLWVREQLKTLCPEFTFNNQIQKRVGCCSYMITVNKAKAVHKRLKEIIDLPYRLSRKWDIPSYDYLAH